MTALLGLLLATAATPAGQEPLPRLPAPLAWLVDQDDYPQVSRHLVVLEPGADAPVTALDNLLYCFDAADHQAVAWCGDLLYVNGPRPRTRPTPNVGMPLNVLARATEGWRPLAPWHVGLEHQHFTPSPTGGGVLVHGNFRLGFLAPGEVAPERARWLLTAEQGLGRAQLRDVVWSADGRSVYASVVGHRSGMEDGLWRLDARLRDDGSIDGFGDPVRVDATRGIPRTATGDGALLATQRNERDFYATRTLLSVRPGTDREARTLVEDLHWNESFAAEPEVLGRSDRAPGPPRVAYVRAGDGVVLLRSDAVAASDEEGDSPADAEVRALWEGGDADGLTWSPDGRWLAFHARDAERKPHVWVVAVDSGKAYRLGPGRRPAWGPPPAPGTGPSLPANDAETAGGR